MHYSLYHYELPNKNLIYLKLDTRVVCTLVAEILQEKLFKIPSSNSDRSSVDALSIAVFMSDYKNTYSQRTDEKTNIAPSNVRLFADGQLK